MSSKETTWDIPYHKAFFKTSHNSFNMSIRKQLNHGVRGLEYDIHDDRIQEINDFEVYHLPKHVDTAINVDGNPGDLLLSNWFSLLKDWSDEQNNEHAPITLFIELKDCIVDANNEPSELYGIKKLNKVINDTLSPNYLYTHSDFRKNNHLWPTVRELKGRIIIVLTSYWGGYWASSEGGFESRLQYLDLCLRGEDDVCFVSWIEEDKGKQKLFMKEKATFWKCSIELSTKHYEENLKIHRATRVDYDKIRMGRHVKTYYEKNYENGFKANFFATDSWAEEKYGKVFPWSI
ncbi:MAG: hypothetical protein KGD74_05000 [Candidatus Lokiarchaeota archaeon]|nr:hypothetical protein [Candidatus Lokiarchaeota archaeon]